MNYKKYDEINDRENSIETYSRLSKKFKEDVKAECIDDFNNHPYADELFEIAFENAEYYSHASFKGHCITCRQYCEVIHDVLIFLNDNNHIVG